MPQSALDCLGKLLMEQVRDHTIEVVYAKLSGKMQCSTNIAELNDEQLRAVEKCCPAIVDETIHWLLVLLETGQGPRMAVDLPSGEVVEDIEEISDGLPHELYTEDGWISRFSKYPGSL